MLTWDSIAEGIRPAVIRNDAALEDDRRDIQLRTDLVRSPERDLSTTDAHEEVPELIFLVVGRNRPAAVSE